MKKRTILKRITSFVLLFALVVGMTTAYTKRTEAAGGWKVTLKYYNGEVFKTYYNCPTNSTLKLPSPAKSFSGANFVGWRIGNEVISAGTIITIKGNMEFVGVWSFYVSYNANGVVTRILQKTGYKYILPSTTPKKQNYNFAYWVDSKGRTIPSIANDLSRNYFYAKFRETPDYACSLIDRVLKGAYDPDGIMGIGEYGIKPKKDSINFGYVRQCDRPEYDKNGNYVYKDVEEKDKNGNTIIVKRQKFVGLCTYCAFTNLLNRRSVLDYGCCKFLFEEHVLYKMYPVADRAKDGVFNREANDTYYRYKNAGKSTGGSAINEHGEDVIVFVGNNGVSYTMVKKKTNGMERSKLQRLLIEHPEGVVIYSGGHAAVVTAYDAEHGKFFCVDTGSHEGTRYSSKAQTLDAVWISDNYKNDKENNVLKNTTYYWYIY